jgi:two-component system NtrC family sensor kinase
LKSIRVRRRNEERWRKGLHKLPGAWIVVALRTGIVLDASAQFLQMLCIDREQLVHRSILEFSHDPVDTQWVSKRFDATLVQVVGRHEDILLAGGDPGRVLVDVHVSKPIRFSGRRAALCLISDGTERHRLQTELIAKHKQLRKAFLDLEQKSADLIRLNGEIGELSAILSRASSLAAIGELTAELTHQLNNPLAAAISTARRIEKVMAKHNIEGYQAMSDLLKDSLNRLKDTMSELKRVYRNARGAGTVPEPIDLVNQLDSAMMLLQQRLSQVEVVRDIEPELPCIIGRPAEIQHVLVNLIDNALQAMHEDGKLEIRVRSSRERIHLSIGDNGPGIPEDQRERVFEPFFTTREQGSGLGLSVVRRNIQNNKATIRVGRSALGGAEFDIGFLMEIR